MHIEVNEYVLSGHALDKPPNVISFSFFAAIHQLWC